MTFCESRSLKALDFPIAKFSCTDATIVAAANPPPVTVADEPVAEQLLAVLPEVAIDPSEERA